MNVWAKPIAEAQTPDVLLCGLITVTFKLFCPVSSCLGSIKYISSPLMWWVKIINFKCCWTVTSSWQALSRENRILPAKIRYWDNNRVLVMNIVFFLKKLVAETLLWRGAEWGWTERTWVNLILLNLRDNSSQPHTSHHNTLFLYNIKKPTRNWRTCAYIWD